LTSLTFSDQCFDVVLVSGVLEHIPAYESAISEVCRTATTYVILHRCATTDSIENRYASGFLYNIKTPRIFYSREILIKEFEKHGFSLHGEIAAATNRKPGIISLLKRIVRQTVLRSNRERQEMTFIFIRK
jgi:hypothetical protein